MQSQPCKQNIATIITATPPAQTHLHMTKPMRSSQSLFNRWSLQTGKLRKSCDIYFK